MKNHFRFQMMAWLLAGTAGFFAGALALLTLIAVTDFDYWTAGENGSSRSEVLRNFLFMGVGVVGAVLASVRLYYLDQQIKTANRQADTANQEAKIANKQQALAERGQITERFSRAVEYLGNEYSAVRLGGIYALWRLLDDIPNQNEETQQKDVVSIIDTLTAFVRGYDKSGRKKRSGKTKNATNSKYSQDMLRYDVETIVKLIGEKNVRYRSLLPTDYRISLVRANLRFGVFGGINLSNILAVEANFSDCNLYNVNFSKASMSGVDFSNSSLHKADCRDTNFTGGVLVGAKFNQAMFKGADFDRADISGANFENAQGLTQEQLDSAVCAKNNPPKNLQHRLKAPTRTPQDVNHPYSKTK